MRRLFGRVLRLLLGLTVAALLFAAIGPLLLIDPAPLPADAPADAADAACTVLPFPGTDGLRFHVVDRAAVGGTPAVPRTFVLLHGFTFNTSTWDRLTPALRRHGRVLAYDQLPYGRSAKPLPGTWSGPSPYAKAAALQQLRALLDARGIERAILVGNSSGATLALEAAHAWPGRVEALVLLAPWVYSQRPQLPSWLIELPQLQRLLLGLARWLGSTAPLLDRSYADPSRIDADRRRAALVHRATAGWDLAWAALLAQSLADRVDIARHLADITAPTLVISGSADRIVAPADSRAAAAALAAADYVELPGCGHLPQEECSDAVDAAVARWLRTR